MNETQSARPSWLVVIVAVAAVAIMVAGRQRDLDWLIPIGTVLLGAVLLSPVGRFLGDDDFRSRILGTQIARQLDGRTFQLIFGAAVAAIGVFWWLLELLQTGL
jgi:hypothetical protein